MNGHELPPMTMPSAGSTLAFVAVVLLVCTLFVLGVRRSYPAGKPAQRATLFAAIGVSTLLALTFVLAESGFVKSLAYTPGVMAYLGTWNLLAVGVALSPVGRRMAKALPLAAIVAFQGFRLPLELVLHRWFEEGVLPVQMTYAGENFDIVSGILGLVVGLLLWKGPSSVGFRRPLAWLFGIVGLGLLFAVIRIAVLSSPVPFNAYPEGPLVQLVFYAPYTWILPICVAGAMGGHVLLFRKLLAKE